MARGTKKKPKRNAKKSKPQKKARQKSKQTPQARQKPKTRHRYRRPRQAQYRRGSWYPRSYYHHPITYYRDRYIVPVAAPPPVLARPPLMPERPLLMPMPARRPPPVAAVYRPPLVQALRPHYANMVPWDFNIQWYDYVIYAITSYVCVFGLRHNSIYKRAGVPQQGSKKKGSFFLMIYFNIQWYVSIKIFKL